MAEAYENLRSYTKSIAWYRKYCDLEPSEEAYGFLIDVCFGNHDYQKIQDILKQMEQPEISLEESFSLYQQGVLQLKNCGTILDEVEKKMQILGEDGEIEEM